MSGRIVPAARAALSVTRSVGAAVASTQVVISILIILFAAGCVANTMQGYVGQDIRTVMLDHGPPMNEIDLGDGTHAFQWSTTSIGSTPVSAVTTTSKDKKGRKTTETQFVGGTETVTNCLYTFVAVWNSERKGWVVTGFRQPSLDCAIGGLS